MYTAALIGWDPAIPPSIWTRYTRALLVSKDRRHLLVTLWYNDKYVAFIFFVLKCCSIFTSLGWIIFCFKVFSKLDCRKIISGAWHWLESSMSGPMITRVLWFYRCQILILDTLFFWAILGAFVFRVCYDISVTKIQTIQNIQKIWANLTF